MVIRVNPQQVVPNQFALDAQALKNEQMKYLMDKQMIDQAQADLGGVMDFFDRRAVLDQIAPQTQQLGGATPSQGTQPTIEQELGEAFPTEESEARFIQNTASLTGDNVDPVKASKDLNVIADSIEAGGGDAQETREIGQMFITNPQQAKVAIGNINQMLQSKAYRRMLARNPAAAAQFAQGMGVGGKPTGMSEMDKFKLDMLKEELKSKRDIDKDWQKSEWDIAKNETKDIKKRAGVINSALKKIEGLASQMSPEGLLPRTAINAGIMSLARMISPGVVTDKDAAAVAGVGTPTQQLMNVFKKGYDKAISKGDKDAAEKFQQAQTDLQRSLDPANPYTFNVEGFKKIAQTVAGAEASTIQAQWKDASSRAKRSGMSDKVYNTNFGGMSSLIASLDKLSPSDSNKSGDLGDGFTVEFK